MIKVFPWNTVIESQHLLPLTMKMMMGLDSPEITFELVALGLRVIVVIFSVETVRPANVNNLDPPV